jgi:hypothetical protein
MTANDYRAALKSLGWSHADAARYLDITERTSRRFASGRIPVHTDKAEIIETLLGARP